MGSYFLKPHISDWVSTVTQQIRFAPDRKAIEQELTAHYEDHKQALLDLGYDEELAAERSLDAMGDPVEVGQALNKIHKYWLGVLWKASQILLLTVVVLAVFLAIREHQSPAWPSPWQRTMEEIAYPAPPASVAHRDVPGGTVYVAFEEDTSVDAETGNTIYSVDLWCERDGITASNFSLGLHFADDQGPIDEKAQPQYGVLSAPQPSSYWTVDWGQDSTGWLRSHCRLLLVLDHEPAWFEISVPYGEAPWSLRCNREVTP